MASVCPRCRAVLPVATVSRCGNCGEVLGTAVSGKHPGITPQAVSMPAVSVSQALAAAPNGAVATRGPRVTAKFPDGTTANVVLTGRTTLGRHPANSLRVQDREVSKEHAVIEHVETGFVVKDLGSSNGTFVNGRRIKEMKLRDGDQIGVGNTVITFKTTDDTIEDQLPGGTRRGVTVVASAASIPAFIAQIDQEKANSEFQPHERITDVAQLRQDYEKLRIAHEFHRQVGVERDQNSLFDKILKVAFQLLAADNGVLFLVDAKKALTPVAVHHRKGEQQVMLSETVLKRVMETRQAVLTADAILDSRFSASESIVAQGIRSAMAVPLLTKGELKGLIFLDTRERTNAFSEKDLKILSGVASQAAIALENAELARTIEKEAVTRAELSRFLSPKVAEMVVKGQVEVLREGRLADVTVLFADIRGFTSMSETEDPQTVVQMLNDFFTAMAGIIFRHEGNLDKFIGDCVMAVWGPPTPHGDDPERALKAALEMQRETIALNERRIAEGKKPIGVGIGINTGQAVVGYMGSQDRHEFTAIGDSVNIASRLCGLAKEGEIIASSTTVDRAGSVFDVELLPEAHVKGKEKSVKTFKVVGLESTAAITR